MSRQKAFFSPSCVGLRVDCHAITHLVCSVKAGDKNASHGFYSHLLPISGKKLHILHNSLNWAAGVYPSFWRKIPRARPGVLSPGIPPRVSKVKLLPWKVNMWFFSFLITLLQFLPVESFFNLRAFGSTFKVLTWVIDPKVNTEVVAKRTRSLQGN